jgi:hypothetical protein
MHEPDLPFNVKVPSAFGVNEHNTAGWHVPKASATCLRASFHVTLRAKRQTRVFIGPPPAGRTKAKAVEDIAGRMLLLVVFAYRPLLRGDLVEIILHVLSQVAGPEIAHIGRLGTRAGDFVPPKAQEGPKVSV